MTTAYTPGAAAIQYQFDASRRAINQTRAPEVKEVVNMGALALSQFRSRLAASVNKTETTPGAGLIDRLVSHLRTFAVEPLTANPNSPTIAEQVSQIKIQTGRAMIETQDQAHATADKMASRNSNIDAPRA